MKPAITLPDAPPVPTPPCCEVWPKILHEFKWFRKHDQQDSPYRESPWMGDCEPVHFCPSCGADRRGVVETFDTIEASAWAAL